MTTRGVTGETRAAYLFLLPWFLGLAGITAGPLLASLYLSFTQYDLTAAPHWIGLQNFTRILVADPRARTAARVTLFYVGVSVPLVTVVSLLMAVVLNRGLRGMALYRTAFYIPSVIGTSVAVALLWRQVFGVDGVFNDLLALVGIRGRSWIGNPGTAMNTLVALRVWTFGAAMVIFLAALRQVPRELYEAASIDGAGPVRRFFRITLPQLTPVLFFILVLETIQAFQAFTQAHVVSGGTGGPLDSTLMFTLYLYQQAFLQQHMGYGSAMAWLLLLAIAGVTGLFFLSARLWVFYDD